jgi:hypothetical protein
MWVHARVPGQAGCRCRHDHLIPPFLRAERIHPQYLYRDPLAREAIAELVTRSKRDAIGRELRAMAYRAGLTV